MIYQDIPKKATQTFIKYKAYSDKKSKASESKKADFVFVLQLKTDHLGNKILFTDFRWIGLFNNEKVLTNYNYLVCKFGTIKIQMPHCMQLRQFTPKEPLHDVQITPEKFKTNQEVIIKHDDLYARAWDCDCERTLFDANDVIRRSPIRAKKKYDLTDHSKMSNTPETSQELSPKIPPLTDGVCDETDTYPCTEMGLEQHHCSPTNPRCSKYDLRQNPKPNGNDDYRH